MADNITAPAAGSVLATKDIGGVQYPKNLITDQAGVDVIGAVTADPEDYTLLARLRDIAQSLSNAVYYPVTQPVTGTFWQATQPISVASLPLPTGAATEATAASASAKLPASLGAKTGAGSLSVIPATDAQFVSAGVEYEAVAASSTNQPLGATGATGDLLVGVLVTPTTTSPGAVSIKDGAGAAITVFTGGSSSVSNLVPFFIPLGVRSTAGAWQITTGASVSAIGVGDFS